jgi:hypothetical protein
MLRLGAFERKHSPLNACASRVNDELHAFDDSDVALSRIGA